MNQDWNSDLTNLLALGYGVGRAVEEITGKYEVDTKDVLTRITQIFKEKRGA